VYIFTVTFGKLALRDKPPIDAMDAPNECPDRIRILFKGIKIYDNQKITGRHDRVARVDLQLFLDHRDNFRCDRVVCCEKANVDTCIPYVIDAW